MIIAKLFTLIGIGDFGDILCHAIKCGKIYCGNDPFSVILGDDTVKNLQNKKQLSNNVLGLLLKQILK